jgi:hypothetical protein
MGSLQVQDLAVAVNENASAGPAFSVLEGHQFHAIPRFLSWSGSFPGPSGGCQPGGFLISHNPDGVRPIKSRRRAAVKRGGVPKSQ